MKQIKQYLSADGVKLLTIQVHKGKTGYNVHASHKNGDGPTQTGCRQQFKAEGPALELFNKLCEIAEANGMTERTKRSKNAFDISQLAQLLIGDVV